MQVRCRTGSLDTLLSDDRYKGQKMVVYGHRSSLCEAHVYVLSLVSLCLSLKEDGNGRDSFK